VLRRDDGENETIEIATKPNAGVDFLPGKDDDITVEVKYKEKQPDGADLARSELNILHTEPQSFETVMVDPGETTTEVIVDADGNKRIIVRKTRRTLVTQQQFVSSQSQQFRSVMTRDGEVVPGSENVAFSQVVLQGQQAAVSHLQPDGSTQVTTSQGYVGRIAAGAPEGEVTVTDFSSQPQSKTVTYQGAPPQELMLSFPGVDHPEVTAFPMDFTEDGKVITSSSSVRATVQQVKRRMVRRKRRIIRKVVIVDGKEEVVEEIVDEPEDIEISEEGIPRVSIEINRSGDDPKLEWEAIPETTATSSDGKRDTTESDTMTDGGKILDSEFDESKVESPSKSKSPSVLSRFAKKTKKMIRKAIGTEEGEYVVNPDIETEQRAEFYTSTSDLSQSPDVGMSRKSHSPEAGSDLLRQTHDFIRNERGEFQEKPIGETVLKPVPKPRTRIPSPSREVPSDIEQEPDDIKPRKKPPFGGVRIGPEITEAEMLQLRNVEGEQTGDVYGVIQQLTSRVVTKRRKVIRKTVVGSDGKEHISEEIIELPDEVEETVGKPEYSISRENLNIPEGWEATTTEVTTPTLITRKVKRTKHVIRKVVIIDGKEHISEQVVEDPEQVKSEIIPGSETVSTYSFKKATKSSGREGGPQLVLPLETETMRSKSPNLHENFVKKSRHIVRKVRSPDGTEKIVSDVRDEPEGPMTEFYLKSDDILRRITKMIAIRKIVFENGTEKITEEVIEEPELEIPLTFEGTQPILITRRVFITAYPDGKHEVIEEEIETTTMETRILFIKRIICTTTVIEGQRYVVEEHLDEDGNPTDQKTLVPDNLCPIVDYIRNPDMTWNDVSVTEYVSKKSHYNDQSTEKHFQASPVRDRRSKGHPPHTRIVTKTTRTVRTHLIPGQPSKISQEERQEPQELIRTDPDQTKPLHEINIIYFTVTPEGKETRTHETIELYEQQKDKTLLLISTTTREFVEGSVKPPQKVERVDRPTPPGQTDINKKFIDTERQLRTEGTVFLPDEQQPNGRALPKSKDTVDGKQRTSGKKEKSKDKKDKDRRAEVESKPETAEKEKKSKRDSLERSPRDGSESPSVVSRLVSKTKKIFQKKVGADGKEVVVEVEVPDEPATTTIVTTATVTKKRDLSPEPERESKTRKSVSLETEREPDLTRLPSTEEFLQTENKFWSERPDPDQPNAPLMTQKIDKKGESKRAASPDVGTKTATTTKVEEIRTIKRTVIIVRKLIGPDGKEHVTHEVVEEPVEVTENDTAPPKKTRKIVTIIIGPDGKQSKTEQEVDVPADGKDPWATKVIIRKIKIVRKITLPNGEQRLTEEEKEESVPVLDDPTRTAPARKTVYIEVTPDGQERIAEEIFEDSEEKTDGVLSRIVNRTRKIFSRVIGPDGQETIKEEVVVDAVPSQSEDKPPPDHIASTGDFLSSQRAYWDERPDPRPTKAQQFPSVSTTPEAPSPPPRKTSPEDPSKKKDKKKKEKRKSESEQEATTPATPGKEKKSKEEVKSKRDSLERQTRDGSESPSGFSRFVSKTKKIFQKKIGPDGKEVEVEVEIPQDPEVSTTVVTTTTMTKTSREKSLQPEEDKGKQLPDKGAQKAPDLKTKSTEPAEKLNISRPPSTEEFLKSQRDFWDERPDELFPKAPEKPKKEKEEMSNQLTSVPSDSVEPKATVDTKPVQKTVKIKRTKIIVRKLIGPDGNEHVTREVVEEPEDAPTDAKPIKKTKKIITIVIGPDGKQTQTEEEVDVPADGKDPWATRVVIRKVKIVRKIILPNGEERSAEEEKEESVLVPVLDEPGVAILPNKTVYIEVTPDGKERITEEILEEPEEPAEGVLPRFIKRTRKIFRRVIGPDGQEKITEEVFVTAVPSEDTPRDGDKPLLDRLASTEDFLSSQRAFWDERPDPKPARAQQFPPVSSMPEAPLPPPRKTSPHDESKKKEKKKKDKKSYENESEPSSPATIEKDIKTKEERKTKRDSLERCPRDGSGSPSGFSRLVLKTKKIFQKKVGPDGKEVEVEVEVPREPEFTTTVTTTTFSQESPEGPEDKAKPLPEKGDKDIAESKSTSPDDGKSDLSWLPSTEEFLQSQRKFWDERPDAPVTKALKKPSKDTKEKSQKPMPEAESPGITSSMAEAQPVPAVRKIKRTKIIVRKCVGSDGKEHVSREVVEEPEEVTPGDAKPIKNTRKVITIVVGPDGKQTQTEEEVDTPADGKDPWATKIVMRKVKIVRKIILPSGEERFTEEDDEESVPVLDDATAMSPPEKTVYIEVTPDGKERVTEEVLEEREVVSDGVLSRIVRRTRKIFRRLTGPDGQENVSEEFVVDAVPAVDSPPSGDKLPLDRLASTEDFLSSQRAYWDERPDPKLTKTQPIPSESTTPEAPVPPPRKTSPKDANKKKDKKKKDKKKSESDSEPATSDKDKKPKEYAKTKRDSLERTARDGSESPSGLSRFVSKTKRIFQKKIGPDGKEVDVELEVPHEPEVITTVTTTTTLVKSPGAKDLKGKSPQKELVTDRKSKSSEGEKPNLSRLSSEEFLQSQRDFWDERPDGPVTKIPEKPARDPKDKSKKSASEPTTPETAGDGAEPVPTVRKVKRTKIIVRKLIGPDGKEHISREVLEEPEEPSDSKSTKKTRKIITIVIGPDGKRTQTEEEVDIPAEGKDPWATKVVIRKTKIVRKIILPSGEVKLTEEEKEEPSHVLVDGLFEAEPPRKTIYVEVTPDGKERVMEEVSEEPEGVLSLLVKRTRKIFRRAQGPDGQEQITEEFVVDSVPSAETPTDGDKPAFDRLASTEDFLYSQRAFWDERPDPKPTVSAGQQFPSWATTPEVPSPPPRKSSPEDAKKRDKKKKDKKQSESESEPTPVTPVKDKKPKDTARDGSESPSGFSRLMSKTKQIFQKKVDPDGKEVEIEGEIPREPEVTTVTTTTLTTNSSESQLPKEKAKISPEEDAKKISDRKSKSPDDKEPEVSQIPSTEEFLKSQCEFWDERPDALITQSPEQSTETTKEMSKETTPGLKPLQTQTTVTNVESQLVKTTGKIKRTKIVVRKLVGPDGKEHVTREVVEEPEDEAPSDITPSKKIRKVITILIGPDGKQTQTEEEVDVPTDDKDPWATKIVIRKIKIVRKVILPSGEEHLTEEEKEEPVPVLDEPGLAPPPNKTVYIDVTSDGQERVIEEVLEEPEVDEDGVLSRIVKRTRKIFRRVTGPDGQEKITEEVLVDALPTSEKPPLDPLALTGDFLFSQRAYWDERPDPKPTKTQQYPSDSPTSEAPTPPPRKSSPEDMDKKKGKKKKDKKKSESDSESSTPVTPSKEKKLKEEPKSKRDSLERNARDGSESPSGFSRLVSKTKKIFQKKIGPDGKEVDVEIEVPRDPTVMTTITTTTVKSSEESPEPKVSAEKDATKTADRKSKSPEPEEKKDLSRLPSTEEFLQSQREFWDERPDAPSTKATEKPSKDPEKRLKKSEQKAIVETSPSVRPQKVKRTKIIVRKMVGPDGKELISREVVQEPLEVTENGEGPAKKTRKIITIIIGPDGKQTQTEEEVDIPADGKDPWATKVVIRKIKVVRKVILPSGEEQLTEEEKEESVPVLDEPGFASPPNKTVFIEVTPDGKERVTEEILEEPEESGDGVLSRLVKRTRKIFRRVTDPDGQEKIAEEVVVTAVPSESNLGSAEKPPLDRLASTEDFLSSQKAYWDERPDPKPTVSTTQLSNDSTPVTPSDSRNKDKKDKKKEKPKPSTPVSLEKDESKQDSLERAPRDSSETSVVSRIVSKTKKIFQKRIGPDGKEVVVEVEVPDEPTTSTTVTTTTTASKKRDLSPKPKEDKREPSSEKDPKKSKDRKSKTPELEEKSSLAHVPLTEEFLRSERQFWDERPDPIQPKERIPETPKRKNAKDKSKKSATPEPEQAKPIKAKRTVKKTKIIVRKVVAPDGSETVTREVLEEPEGVPFGESPTASPKKKTRKIINIVIGPDGKETKTEEEVDVPAEGKDPWATKVVIRKVKVIKKNIQPDGSHQVTEEEAEEPVHVIDDGDDSKAVIPRRKTVFIEVCLYFISV